MSGRRHHYIPRFLQAGFNSRPRERVPRAWLYRKGASGPVEAALKDIGVEKDFYQATVGGVTISADDAMTQAENARLSRLVHELRCANSGVVENSEGVAELFANIQLRTKAAWLWTTTSVESLTLLIQEDAEAQGIVMNILQFMADMQPDMLASFIAPANLGTDQKVIVEGLSELWKGTTAAELFVPTLKLMVGSSLRDLVLDVVGMIKVWAMGHMATHPGSQMDFKGCTFAIRDFSDVRLVQGDAPVVYCRIGSGFTAVLREGEVFDFAFLPLTSTRALVASNGGTPNDGEALKMASIRCSLNHFIFDAEDERLQALAGTIGEGVPNITVEDVKEMLTNPFTEAQRADCMAFLGTQGFQEILKKWTH